MGTVGSAPRGAASRARSGSWGVKLLAILIVLILLFLGYCYMVLHWSYSTGERAGWVQKLSHKGWICKTWEGELAMMSMPGTAPEKFYFTIMDDQVAAAVNRLNGHRVSLSYEQKVGIPTNCFGETEYYVVGVRPVEDIPLVPAPSGGAAAPAGTSPGAPGSSATPGQSSAPPASGTSGSGVPGGGVPGSGMPGSGVPGTGMPGSGAPVPGGGTAPPAGAAPGKNP